MLETHEKERSRFGLDPKISQKLDDPNQEEESMLVFENEDQALSDLPWYIMNPNSMLYRVQNIQIQMMTWITVVLTPLIIVFDMMDPEENMQSKMIWLVWVNDISWCIEIILSFLVASPNNRTFKDISIAYLKGYFIFDVLATIPPMMTG